LTRAILPQPSRLLPPQAFVSKTNVLRTELDGSQPRRILKITYQHEQPITHSTAGILGKRDAVKATANAAEALIDAAIA
jgi:hypothetical protein